MILCVRKIDIILKTSFRRRNLFFFPSESPPYPSNCHVPLLCLLLKKGVQILCRRRHSADLGQFLGGEVKRSEAASGGAAWAGLSTSILTRVSQVSILGLYTKFHMERKKGSSADSVFKPPVTKRTISLTHQERGHQLRKETRTHGTVFSTLLPQREF